MKLMAAVDQYILHRQALGQKFESPAVALRAFSRRYSHKPLPAITLSEVKQFLDVPPTGPATWRRKYGVLRDFFVYWQCRGKLKTLPLPPTLPQCPPSFVPYIYSRRELRLLLKTVPRCQQPAGCRMSALTFHTFLLLLYGTGLRVGEALRLRLADVDLEEHVITIRGTKFYKSRFVPLGGDVVRLLRKYLDAPERAKQQDQPLFQTRQQQPLRHRLVNFAFQRLRKLAGVRRSETSSRQPRLHDLRHTFAVHRLTEWYRQEADVQVLLPALSTYLGHTDLHSTQWYLTMTPELLQEANRRFQDWVYGGPYEQ